MQETVALGAVQIYAHSANAGFAERIAAGLDRARYRIVTGAFDQLAVDAVIVVWSGAAINSEKLIAAAAEPFACGAVVPVSIGLVEPPPGFRDVEPVDLGGWSGDPDDPRWRFVLGEIERLARPAAPIGAAAPADARPLVADALAAARAEEAPTLWTRALETAAARLTPLKSRLAALPRATLASAMTLSAAFIIGAFLLLAPNSEPAGGGGDALVAATPGADAPMLAAVRPVAPSPTEQPAAAATEPAPEGPPPNGEREPAVLAEAPAAPATAGPSAAMAPRLAPARAPDRIAALIETNLGAAQAEPAAAEAPYAAAEPFRDCPACPEMVVLPAGSFAMGSPASEPSRQPVEGPLTEIALTAPIAIGAHEVTFAEWDACVADGGCNQHAPSDAGWGRANRPVINVSWNDAQAYVAWLSEETGRQYRLPSEAEWEYAARAGAATPFAFGRTVAAEQANFDGAHPYGAGPGKDRARTTPVGSFAANPFGLHDVHGNVWEWTADCWHASHAGRPGDATARGGECQSRVLKGGAWNSGGWRLRAGHRIAKPAAAREYDNGFRVARAAD